MPGLLEGLSQGLQGAGGILSPDVFTMQAQERARQASALNQQRMLMQQLGAHAVQSGALPPDAGPGLGLPAGLGPDAMTQQRTRAAAAETAVSQAIAPFMEQQDYRGALATVAKIPGGLETGSGKQLYEIVQRQITHENDKANRFKAADYTPETWTPFVQGGMKDPTILVARPLTEDAAKRSPLATMIAERDALPPDDPRRVTYDNAIRKSSETAQQIVPRITVNAGDKTPSGYRVAAGGNLEFIPGGPADPARNGGFSGRNGEILAAMAERGASLPTGFRSKEQQAGLLTSLSSRYPDLSPDQIADKIVKGQLDLTGLKKEVQVAGSQAGKIAYAENEIDQTIPLVREASAKLPRGRFVPYERLKQMGEAAFSDPDLAEFKMYMTSLSNAYDMLAARGGTDMEKRKENRRNFDTAPSPEALERVLQAVKKEAQASGRAAKASMDVTRNRDAPAGGNVVKFGDLKP